MRAWFKSVESEASRLPFKMLVAHIQLLKPERKKSPTPQYKRELWPSCLNLNISFFFPGFSA